MSDSLESLKAALADRYAIEHELGAGGMANVYLADDLKHHRKVAIKVMRPELAAVIGADRFLVEIRTTANLQHPHILPLHDSGEVNGTVFYVMPFVEGESLRDRLDREQLLPVADALRIVSEVAAALDYAHRHGVIHRDIKPENILLHDGSALVADFGIALAASRSEGGSRMTETGMSLGTPTYMSPEQAMGERTLDARTDVYALGCVLYESLVGEPPFTGPSAQAIIARVMTESPRSLTAQRNTVPFHVDAAVGVALAKLPADRFATAAAFAEALAHPGATNAMTAARGVVAGPPKPRWLTVLPWAVTAVALVAAAWAWQGRGSEAAPSREFLSFGRSLQAMWDTRAGFAISPDGETVAFSDSVTRQLWVKRAASLEAVAVPGTEDAFGPAFSPDGEWLAFIADGKVKKSRLDGSAPTTLADSAEQSYGGVAWLDDGTLIYAGTGGFVMYRVAATGGTVTKVLPESALPGLSFVTLAPLPGARGVIFGVCNTGCAEYSLHVLDVAAGTEHLVAADGIAGVYLPSGHLLYTRFDGTAVAAPFDLDALATTGPPVQVLDNLIPRQQIGISRTGTLVYGRQAGPALGAEFVRLDRTGTVTRIDSSWYGDFTNGEFSPTGDRFATSVGIRTGNQSIWIKQLDTGAFSRLTSGQTDRRPTWSPDGQTIAFVHDSALVGQVYTQPADGSRPAARFLGLDRGIQEVDWSPDGQWLVVRTDNGEAGAGDILAIPTSGDATAINVVATPAPEYYPVVSPDGRWIAYTSEVSGKPEVYINRFPSGDGGRRQVSLNGGIQPRWSADGRELYYIASRVLSTTNAAGTMTAAELRLGEGVEVIARRELFQTDGFGFEGIHQSYDIDPRDGRFSFRRVRQDTASGSAPGLVRINNWPAVLRELLAR
jgi:serine/threonine-protein kinase